MIHICKSPPRAVVAHRPRPSERRRNGLGGALLNQVLKLTPLENAGVIGK
jgi:hypothetical protein